MAPKKAQAAPGEKATPTPTLALGDMRIIDAIFKTCGPPAKPNVADWDGIATQLNLSNAKVARERFRQVCKKYNWFENTGAGPVTPSSSPRMAAVEGSAGTKRVKTSSSGDEADIKATPVKKRKSNTKAKRGPRVKTEAGARKAQGGRDSTLEEEEELINFDFADGEA